MSAEPLCRCAWVPVNDAVYCAYHDTEWGVAVYDDHRMYEMFLLETFQAGLSWITILKKRENFRKAFDDFDPEKIARYDGEKIALLLSDPGIIRCRRKIEAAIENANVVLTLQKEFGSFANYLWHFTKGRIVRNGEERPPVKTELSDRISEDLIRRGMHYVGSVTIYSFLQAVGIVNDHEPQCFRHEK